MKTSIDQEEVRKFAALAGDWFKKNGSFSALHKINPLRLKYITSKISTHFNLPLDNAQTSLSPNLQHLRILDVGCGGGLISKPLSQLRAKVTAIDASAENINAAAEHAQQHNLKINYRHTTIEQIAGKEALNYDVVICLEVIEHVADLDYFIANLATVLREGGMMLISTINRNPKSYLLTIAIAEYLLRLIPPRTHQYSKYVKPSELNNLLFKYNMTLKELQGLKFDLIQQKWYLSDSVDVNYFAYVIK